MLTYGSTFVAQSYAGNPKVTGDIIRQAIEHKGFSFVNIFSPCPTYNKIDTFQFYKTRISNINETHSDTTDRIKAFELAETSNDHTKDPEAKIPTGIFYQIEKPVYEDKVKELKTRYKGSDDLDVKTLYEQFRA